MVQFLILASFISIFFTGCRPSLTESQKREAAGQIFQTIKGLYGGIHEFKGASIYDYDMIDPEFYESKTDELKTDGFEVLGEVEDVSITRTNPYMKTCIRILSGKEGTVLVALYHRAPAGATGLSKVTFLPTLASGV